MVPFRYDYRHSPRLLVLTQYSIQIYNLKDCVVAGMQIQKVCVCDALARGVKDGFNSMKIL